MLNTRESLTTNIALIKELNSNVAKVGCWVGSRAAGQGVRQMTVGCGRLPFVWCGREGAGRGLGSSTARRLALPWA